MTDPTPVAFFNEAAREAAARECHAQRHTGATWNGHCLTAASAILAAALEALPERSKAILALAALSDEVLVERVVMALAERASWPVGNDTYGSKARHILTALGLPVAEREATG